MSPKSVVRDVYIRPRGGNIIKLSDGHSLVKEIAENTVRISIPVCVGTGDDEGALTLSSDPDWMAAVPKEAQGDLVVDLTFLDGYPVGINSRSPELLGFVRGGRADPRTSIDQFRLSKQAKGTV